MVTLGFCVLPQQGKPIPRSVVNNGASRGDNSFPGAVGYVDSNPGSSVVFGSGALGQTCDLEDGTIPITRDHLIIDTSGLSLPFTLRDTLGVNALEYTGGGTAGIFFQNPGIPGTLRWESNAPTALIANTGGGRVTNTINSGVSLELLGNAILFHNASTGDYAVDVSGGVVSLVGAHTTGFLNDGNGNMVVAIQDGSFDVNQGTFFDNELGAGELTIRGGSFNFSDNATGFLNASSIRIDNGSFQVSGLYSIAFSSRGTAFPNIIINEGTFSFAGGAIGFYNDVFFTPLTPTVSGGTLSFYNGSVAFWDALGEMTPVAIGGSIHINNSILTLGVSVSFTGNSILSVEEGGGSIGGTFQGASQSGGVGVFCEVCQN